MLIFGTLLIDALRAVPFVYLQDRKQFSSGRPSLNGFVCEMAELEACSNGAVLTHLLLFPLLSLQGLVVAGLSDLRRPADQLSVSQSASLAATGIIWSRYSLVIIPKNWGLFSVNVFVAGTQVLQLYRAWDFSRKAPKTAA